MGYRPSSIAPKGRWGIALDELRKQRGWSQQQAFEQLREGLGLGQKSRASYVALEQGKEPSEAQRRYLVSVLGYEPSEAVVGGQATTDPIIAAIDRLTETVARLEDRLDRVAGSTEGLADGLLDLLARLASEHVSSAGASAPPLSGRR